VNEYKKQLNQYSTKYIEIQKTIKDSNKTFDQIRNELARLKVRNEQLEKEKSELKKMVQEARMTGISSPKFVPSRDLSTISTQAQPQGRGRTPETPKNDEMIDIAATPKTIIDIQTPVIFSPSRVNEEVRANASLLHPTEEEDLNEVDL
jgi:cell division septum initiation protein DivIVA